MDLYVIHMRVHHPELPQPDWQISDDLDVDYFTTCEAEFFSEQPSFGGSLEDLRKALGEEYAIAAEIRQQRERELFQLSKDAARLGHRVHLPGEKIPGESGASRGWVCTCGANGHPEPKGNKGAQRDAARAHLRDVLSSS